MTNSVDICGDGSSRHSVGTHGMMPPVCYGRIKTSLDKGTQRKTTENELPSLTQCTA